MKIVIIPNEKKDIGLKVTRRVIEVLRSHGAEMLVGASVCLDEDSVYRYEVFPPDADAILVIGGDGSILDASGYAVQYGIPMLGINLGRVGYMSELAPDRIEELSRLFDGRYEVEEKMLLSLCIDGETVPRLAVNEVIFSHNSPVELTQLTLTDGNGASLKYRADGLIFSTPIGSTAYSLSAGGPIVSQDHPSILVTPICPHSFFGRSIVFSDRETLTVSCGSSAPLIVSIDGRAWGTLKPGSECLIQKSQSVLKMITFLKEKRMNALFSKLRSLDEL